MKQKIQFLFTLFTVLAVAANASPNGQSLSTLNHRISNMQTELKHAKQKRSNIQSALREAEVNSGIMQIQLNQTQQRIKQQKKALQQLEQKEQNIKTQLSQQKNQLSQQLRALYMLGNQPHLRLLLDQDNSRKTNRMAMYLQYLNQARSNDILNIQRLLAQLQQNQQQLQQQYLHLRDILKLQKQQTLKYQVLRHQRSNLIDKINLNIQTHQQKLAALSQDKHRLENTITQLNQNEEVTYYPGTGFSALRGRLHMPSRGKILNMFGHNIQGSQLRWDGILIRTAENNPVYAVADGEVVFAKWLSGYGLLLIISQGHGYMTLYGRLHSLYTRVGQHVNAGEQIATVGESGGFTRPALYFAIRHNAKPLDPLHWCRP